MDGLASYVFFVAGLVFLRHQRHTVFNSFFEMKICRLCGKSQAFHFCREVAPGKVLSCKQLQLKQTQKEKQARERALAADLNGGVSVGKGNKDLLGRLKPLVLRSYAEVAAEMGLSAQAIRLIEMRALKKIKNFLMPFRNSTSGAAKVRQVTAPISSLED